MRKSVLFKIWHYPLLSETFVTSQIITAIKCGYEVNLLIQNFLPIDESGQQEVFNEYKLKEKIIIEDLKIPDNRTKRLFRAFKLILSDLPQVPRLIKYFANGKKMGLTGVYEFFFYAQLKKYDIIHVQFGTNVKPLDVLKRIGALSSSRLLVSFHGHDAFFPVNGIVPNNGYYDDLFKYGDLVVANTYYLANELSLLGCPEEKLKIIPVGVDINFFSPGTNSNLSREFKLISIGRLDKVKGHKYTIEALYLLVSKGLKVKLTIIGEGPERKNLEALIASKNLENQVSLLGKRVRNEVRENLRSHDVYILSSVAVENNRRETQGLATLEAQATGLPAVVFDSGGIKYTVDDGNTGFVVPEYDIDSLAAKIEILLRDTRLRETMGKKAVEFAKARFCQKKIEKIWCSTYNNLFPSLYEA